MLEKEIAEQKKQQLIHLSFSPLFFPIVFILQPLARW
jgi:hypothetical protein